MRRFGDKTLLIVGIMFIVLATVLHAKLGELRDAEYDKVKSELDAYKATYDGIEIYEDGSWDYKDGVDEYYFWNDDWKSLHAPEFLSD